MTRAQGSVRGPGRASPAPRRPFGGLGRRPVILLVLAVIVGVVALARATVATPVSVHSASMLPSFSTGDVVLVSRSEPDVNDLQRGDLITFRSPEDGERALKRVIGLPGDSLVIKDSRLYVNDIEIAEPYVDHALIDGYYSRTYVVAQSRVFVLGDNRGNSVDSRDYGAVAEDDLRGRVLFRVWPVTG